MKYILTALSFLLFVPLASALEVELRVVSAESTILAQDNAAEPFAQITMAVKADGTYVIFQSDELEYFPEFRDKLIQVTLDRIVARERRLADQPEVRKLDCGIYSRPELSERLFRQPTEAGPRFLSLSERELACL